MLLGIAATLIWKSPIFFRPADQRGGIGVAAGMRAVLAAHAGRRVAAQRDDVADAGVPVGARNFVDLALGGGDAGEVGGGVDAGFRLEARHGSRACAGGSSRRRRR